MKHWADSRHLDFHVQNSWKMKKLIKNLDSARGNGTSMISLIKPPGVRPNLSLGVLGSLGRT